jgi:hypothetical protein
MGGLTVEIAFQVHPIGHEWLMGLATRRIAGGDVTESPSIESHG